MAKWTAFGFYLVLEDTTIVSSFPLATVVFGLFHPFANFPKQLHAMGVWHVPWEEQMMHKA